MFLTVHLSHTQHNSGMHWSIVGRPYRVDSTLINPSRDDCPSFGTLVGWLAQRGGHSPVVPPYVITPAPHCDSTVYLTPGQFGGCLGAMYDPLVFNPDPRAGAFKSTFGGKESPGGDRLGERRGLLARLDSAPTFDETLFREFEVNKAKAFSLVGSAQARRAFDLTEEPPAVREH